MNKAFLRINYVRALEAVRSRWFALGVKINGHAASQRDKLAAEVKDIKDEAAKPNPAPPIIALLAALLALSTCSAVADGTNLVANTNEAFAVKYDLEMGAGGSVGDTGGGSVNASLYAAPFAKAQDLWVGASQSAAWRPGSGETDVGAQYSVRLFTDSLWVNPGVSIGGRYGSGSGAFTAGPQVELQWYASDSTYLYGSTGYALVTHGRPGEWWQIGIGWEF